MKKVSMIFDNDKAAKAYELRIVEEVAQDDDGNYIIYVGRLENPIILEKYETFTEVEDYFYAQHIEEDKPYEVLLNIWNEESEIFESETLFEGDYADCCVTISYLHDNEILPNQFIEIIEYDENNCIENSWVKLKGKNIDKIAEKYSLDIKYS